MYELSHGSYAPKERLEYLAYSIFPMLGYAYALASGKDIYFLWSTLILIGIITEFRKPIESKSEPKTETIPTYSLTQTDLLCMLRNAESGKNRNV